MVICKICGKDLWVMELGETPNDMILRDRAEPTRYCKIHRKNTTLEEKRQDALRAWALEEEGAIFATDEGNYADQMGGNGFESVSRVET